MPVRRLTVQRDVSKQNAGVDREVVHSLLGLFDERVAIHFPRQFFGPAAGLFERLVDGHGSDRHGRIPQDPLAGFVNVAAGRKIHHRVGAPRDAPSHLLDFVFDRARYGAVPDVRIDLHQEIAADDHRLGFRMIDVRRNDRPAACHFVADELGRDVFRNARAERLALVLETSGSSDRYATPRRPALGQGSRGSR